MVNKVDGNSYYVYEKPKKMNIPNTGEKFSLGYEKDGLQAESKDKNGVSGQEKQQAMEQSGVRIELSSKGVEKQRQAEAAEKPNASSLTSLIDTLRTFFTAAVAAVKDIFGRIWNDPTSEGSLKDNSGLAETADIADALKDEEAADVIEDMANIEMTGAIGDIESTEMIGAIGDMESAETTTVIRVTEITETTGFTGVMEDTAASRADAENSDREIRKHLRNGDVEQVIRLLTDNGRKTAARNSTLLTFYDKNGRVVKLDASVQQRTLYGDKNTQKL